MARKALVTFDFPSAPTVGGASTWYVTPTGTNASGSWGISITGSASTITGTYSGTLTSGQVTTALGYTPYNSTNPSGYTSNTGTVTSVSLSLPTFITVTGSPVTGAGTLTGTLASQTANTVFVAPNGTAGAPTFRALVEADIPTLSQAKITNLTTDLAAKANLASPAFTGTPSLPTGTTGVTQAQGTNTTALATTAFVQAEIVADAVLLSTNQTVAGNKTFSGTTALASGSTIDGFVIGYRDVPVLISNAARTFALADAGEAFGKDNATAYTYTIPANGTVAFPIGTVITVFNNNATSNITIAITTDTLRLAGTTTTGSRTVPPFALCTLFKVASTVWMASGAGVT